MHAFALLEVAAVLALAGCSASVVPISTSTTTLTSATVSRGRLDDDQIASIARKIQAGHGVLAELALSQGGDLSVRQLGRRLGRDNSATVLPPPTSAPHPSVLEDELTQRDVTTELRLTRFAGHSFDRAFVETDLGMLADDIELVEHVLLPAATSPALQDGLHRLAALLSEERDALQALGAPDQRSQSGGH
jgi:hypothetical protein